MKKIILIAVMSLSLLPVGDLMAKEQEEKIYTVSGPCGYFSGTADECAEFMGMCDDGEI